MADARITFYYALVDETGWCYEVCSTSRNCDEYPDHIAISSLNTDYIEKYYNVEDGKWYLEASFTTEWSPV